MLASKRFQKKLEDFKCDHCGTQVKGSGFTDHCPNCLWGKHVDINPGDRKSACGGAMEPVQVETKGGKYIIHYKCAECGHTFQVKSAENDNFSEITKISTKNI